MYYEITDTKPCMYNPLFSLAASVSRPQQNSPSQDDRLQDTHLSTCVLSLAYSVEGYRLKVITD